VKNNFHTKSEIVYLALKQDIANGRYKPNQRIVASQVARRFGFSEIPVREALKQLESEGVVQNKPHVGATVTDFEIEDYEKILQVRSILEGLATRLAAEHMTEDHFKALEKVCAKMQRVIREKKYEKMPPLDRAFHKIIYEASGNEYLWKTISGYWDLSFWYPGVFAFVPERARNSLPEHNKILNALKKGDGALAEKLDQKQKENSRKAVQTFFKKRKAKAER
jgi:DNA-binding GntR family transcriptional regulator